MTEPACVPGRPPVYPPPEPTDGGTAMRRTGWGVLVGLAAVGCNTPHKYDTSVPYVEEFRPPPDEARYNNPPEQGWKRPPPKKEFKPGAAGMGGGSPGMPPGR